MGDTAARTITKEVRLRKITEVVLSCQTSGMKIADWCKANGILVSTYYKWQRQVREVAIDRMGNSETPLDMPSLIQKFSTTLPVPPRFSELPAMPGPTTEPTPNGRLAIRIQFNSGTVIEIQKETDAHLVESVVRTLAELC